ncbi:MAG: hypothetical protein GWO10_10900 [candidate division Zixibacteria bacterium]|nr:hypothetical protein [candidate division Zixibacteria bacterium]
MHLDGAVDFDVHDSINDGHGWASLTFDTVQATGIRITFSNATSYTYVHYKVHEFQAHFDSFGILSHTPSNFINNYVDHVDVTFSGEINPATFTSDDIIMIGPNGTIDVNELNDQGANVWRINFDTQNKYGEYHVYIGPHIEDPNGNEMDQDGNGTGGEEPNDIYDAAFTLIHTIISSHQKISDIEGNFLGILDDSDIFGRSVARISDLDGDGIDDLAVGTTGDDDGGTNCGAVWILFLNNNGTVKSSQKISNIAGGFDGTLDDNDYFGVSVVSIGDLDNDGVDDLAVGAYQDDDGGDNCGAVWIIFLNNNGTVKSSQKISGLKGGFNGVLNTGDGFGVSVCAVGDLDNDGVDDLAVGAFTDDDGGDDCGAVWILFLNSNGTVKSFQKISRMAGGFNRVLNAGDSFGISVGAMGDLDNDGVDDLAIGAYKDDDGGVNRGAVWILYLNNNGTVKSSQKISNIIGGFDGLLDNYDYFGVSVASIGDLDNNGAIDLAVGAHGDDDGGSGRGAVWVLFLNKDGTVRWFQKISRMEGGFHGLLDDGDFFGVSLAAMGDLDRDGTNDLAVGVYSDDDGGTGRGAVWILFGASMNRLRILDHTPSGIIVNPVFSPVSYVDVTFCTAVNPSTFTIDDITMTGPIGPIDPNAPLHLGGNVWRIGFETLSESGEYHVYIGPHIEEPNGNKMDQNGNAIGGEDPNDIYDATFSLSTDVVSEETGLILYERWDNVAGSYISDLTFDPKYPDNPSTTSTLSSFEGSTNIGDHYGTRIRGYLIPPKTGDYTFWIASDDQGELWLSKDLLPENIMKIAYVNSWTASRQWDKELNQKSDPIYLFGGDTYYIMALQKEDEGDDNLAVAWRGPDFWEEIIPGDYLAVSEASVYIAQHPNPLHYSTNVPIDSHLFWEAPDSALFVNPVYTVYFGTTDPSTGSNPVIYEGSNTTVDPGILEADTTYYWQVDINDLSIGGWPLKCIGRKWRFRTAAAYSGWQSQDIGAVTKSGSATVIDRYSLTVEGNGNDIWETADAFHFFSKPVSGDVVISARVVSIDHPNNPDQTWVKGGVMIRETLEPGSKHAFMAMAPYPRATFQRRVETNQTSSSSHDNSHRVPYWVKIERKGNTFRGYHSPDGLEWFQEGPSVSISMSSEVYIGFAVTSHDNGVLARVLFDNVSQPVIDPSFGLWVTDYSVSDQGDGNIDYVDITFNKPVAPDTFTLDDISLVGPLEQVDVNSILDMGNNVWRVGFDTQSVFGIYYLDVGPHIEDTNGLEMDQDGDGLAGEESEDVFEVSIRSATRISKTDTRFEGRNVVVDGYSIVIDGKHTFQDLIVRNGGVITHTAEQVGFDLTILGDMMVESGGSINVSGKGYDIAEGPGAGRNGRYPASGAGYGGLGGKTIAESGLTYGSITEPIDFGSGGGKNYLLPTSHGSGGGAVKFTVKGNLTVDGSIVSNGYWGRNSSGGGSGGSIFITTSTFSGNGRIKASGGNSSNGGGGGGGGGRIAVYYDVHDFTGTMLACGGSGSQYGGAGTIYTKSSGQNWGELFVDNCDNLGATTPLLAGTYTFDDIEVFNEGRLEVSLDAYLVLVSDVLKIQDNGQLIVYGQVEPIGGGEFSQVQILSGATLLLNKPEKFPSMHIFDGGILSHSTEVKDFELTITGDLTVDSNGAINVDGKGFGRYGGPGAPTGYSGASYGGKGGDGTSGSPGSTYGSVTEPNQLGSGGYTHDSHGGGLIRLTVDGTLMLNGSMTANGEYRSQGSNGSGGSIWVKAGTISGSGVISSNGANYVVSGSFGGGGGGRIAIYFEDATNFDFENVIVNGGTGYETGEPGTIWLSGPDSAPFVSSDTMLPSGLLSGPVNYIDLVFTRPMNEASLMRGVQIWGADGPIEVVSVLLLESIAGRSTYRITFGSMPDGAYQLRISPEIESLNGEHLDQDHDGTAGEPIDDAFESEFTVDTTGPRINRHEPVGDNAGISAYVDVWFSEATAPETFTIAAVTINGPGGYIIPSGITEIGYNCYRISFPSQTIYGQYFINIKPYIKDLAGNLMDQNRNWIHGEEPNDVYIASFNLVDVDLKIGNVVADSNELLVDDPVVISWIGSNDSGAPLLGNWTDAVYLSTDDKWGIDDVLLTQVDHTGGLILNEIYSESVEVVVPGALVGDYYIIVRSDIYNEEKEGADEGNNVVAIGPIPLDIRWIISDGTVIYDSLTAEDYADYYAIDYAIDANAGENLQITLAELPNDTGADLFVSYETIPTWQDYDYTSKTNPIKEGSVVISAGLEGTYYVLVYGKQTSEPNYYEISTVLPDIVITDISPYHHSVSSNCTMTITGVGFDDTTDVNLVASDQSIWTPTDVTVLSSTNIIATLDLPTWPQDTFDIVVTKEVPNGQKGIVAQEVDRVAAVAVGAFEATSGIPYLETRLSVPGAMGYHWANTIWIEYANTGQASMPAPLFKLYGTDNAILTTDQSLAGRGLWTDTPPAGTSDSVQVMAAGSGATPGILQPGDSGRIPVYYLGLRQPWNFNDRGVRFDLSIMPIEDIPIDWNALKDELQPAYLQADAWDAVWKNFTNQVGSTWDDYGKMLNNNMTYLNLVNRTNIGLNNLNISQHVKSLLSLEFRKADGLSPIRYLTSSQDVAVPTPGLSLGLYRAYAQPISRRYQFGPLGRGWAHSWQMYFDTDADGSIMIYDMTGTPRTFQPDGNGGYTPQSGDNGTLIAISGGFKLTELSGLITTFNSNGTLNYVEDKNGNRVAVGYNGSLMTSLTHSNVRQLFFDYNAFNRIWHVTDPRGLGTEDDYIVTYEYDPSGEYLMTVTEPGNRITNYTYETSGTIQQRHALLTITYPDNTNSYFSYDSKGRLTGTNRDGGAEAVTFTHDSTGKVTAQDATGRKIDNYFGPGGQILQVRDGNNNVMNLTYDNNYQLTQVTGPSGEENRYFYNSLGNVVGIEDPSKKITALEYTSAFNNLSGVTDPRGNGIRYSYDAKGNLELITYEDSNSESFTYDSSGNVLTWMNRRGDTVTYTYNSSGQPNSKDYSDTPGIDYQYIYDDAGNLTSASDPNSTTTITYDPDTDWMTRIDYLGVYFFAFEYDDAGRRTKRTDQDGNITNYIYDSIGRLDQITDANSILIVDYDYDASGRLSQKTLGNGVYSTYEYDTTGQLTHLINYNPSHTIISRFDYTYDASARRTSMTTLEGIYNYGYDPLGQLISVTYPDAHMVEYVYDDAGNRIKVIDNGATTNYTTNNMNQYTQVGDTTYTYDADGNMKTKTESGVTTTYTYDIENHLISVTTPNDTWTYKYDAFGNRIASVHNGVMVNYVLDPTGFGNVAAEYDDNGILIAHYDHGYGLLARTDINDISAYYTFDAIGSTSELTDIAGTVANNYKYDPFGISLGKSEVIDNSFQYVGEFGVMNEKNGLGFMRARFYTNQLGRFISHDPIGILSGFNLYNYCSNQPISKMDPIGLNDECVLDTGPNRLHIYFEGNLVDPRHYKHARNMARFLKSIVGPEGARWMTENVWGFFEAWQTAQVWWTMGRQFPWDTDIDLFSNSLGAAAGAYDIDLFFCAWNNSPSLIELLPWRIREILQSLKVLMMDPNKKIAPAGHGTSNFVSEDYLMAYEIQFENMPEATAPAHIIRITDTLDEDLDLDTFELTEIVFANHMIIVPPGLNHYETTVDLSLVGIELVCEINASLNIATRELTLEMIGIDPETGWLPEDIMLGILYPNDETGRGDGHISYVVRPKSGLPTGTKITNKARIYFDWNDPIETELTLNTIDAGLPASEVTVLPADTYSDDFVVSWSGQDDPNGSGIASYDVYVSMDGNDYVLWLDNYADSNALFDGEDGHTYAFYSVAADGVGHMEAPPATPDAVTTVTIVPGDVTADGQVNIDDIAKLAYFWLQDEPSVDIMPTPNGDGIINFRDYSVIAENW